MPNSLWSRLDGFMRLGHLYTGLFLVPWMAVYATSAFCLHHDRWFPPVFQSWQAMKEVSYTADSGAGQEPAEQARTLLKRLDLDGPHRIVGTPTAKELTIWRSCFSGDYRITWRRDKAQVAVQRQQPFSVLRLVHSMHFVRGYDGRYPAATVWALSIDVVVMSTWFWVVSGVYIWTRRPRKRAMGGICLAGGGLLFAVLVGLLCW
jgi:hypothetical protein